MMKSVQVTVHELLATESNQLGEQNIHILWSALEVYVHGADKVTTTNCGQHNVCLNTAGQEIARWLDADCHKANE